MNIPKIQLHNNDRVLDSLGALYDPTLLSPTDPGLGRGSSSIEIDQIRRGDRRGVNNGVPRAVLYLMKFQGD